MRPCCDLSFLLVLASPIFALCLMMPLTSHSQELSMDELFAMSLDELVNISVVTVSKRSELLTDAPGIVTVITAAHIKTYGARNIKDVLLRIPNFYMFDSSTFNATGSSLRAGATQHLNNHILYLINGRPLRESQNGGLHTDINLLFPIEAIERIEVIRGPGSVLYGSNAFNGTINFITKSADKKLQASVNNRTGSHGYGMNSVAIGSHFSNSGQVMLRVNTLDEDGARITGIDDQSTSGAMNLARKGQMAMLTGTFKGFSLQSIVSEITLPSISGPFRWTGLSQFEVKREFLDVSYQYDLNPQWQAALHYTLNQHERFITGPRDSEFFSDGYLYEAVINGEINDDIQLLLGAVVDHIQGDLGETRGGKYKTQHQNMYAQLDYQLNEATKISAGLQWNRPEDQASDTSPRLALIHRFNERWTSKFLYSQAFRSPYGSEIGFVSSFLQGDPDLKPEKIKTLEAQALYGYDNLAMSASYYHSKTSDTIGRSRIDNTTYFVNQDDEITFDGIELEARWAINSAWHLQGNASVQMNEDANDNEDIMIASQSMLKLGISYTSGRGYSASIWNSYFSDVSKIEDQPNSVAIVVNPAADAYNLLSINLDANLGKLLGRPKWQPLDVSLYVDNLFDEEVWFPELGQKSVNTYPQSHARGVYANIKYSF